MELNGRDDGCKVGTLPYLILHVILGTLGRRNSAPCSDGMGKLMGL